MDTNILVNNRRVGRLRLVVPALIGLCLAAPVGFAETGFFDFLSPDFMAGSANSVSLESPPATLLNPAVAAGKQRITLDASYITLMDFSPFLWSGHVVNLGITLPTRVGVFSTVGRFASASFPGLNWGALGGLHLSFAKDLFEDFYIGFGLGFEFGSDWGLWGDLGFMHLPGDLGFMKDFRWGAALRGLGKGYYPPTSSTGVFPDGLAWPPTFTPAVAATFSLIDADPFLLTVSGDLSLPNCMDVRLQLGTGFSAADIVFLSAYLNLDLRQLITVDPARSLPLGFGLSLKIKTKIPTKVETADATERGWNQSEMKVTASAMSMQDGIWAFGLGANLPIGVVDRTPPAITLDVEGEKYISPNFDGVKDDLTLALSITDQRYIKGYKFAVLDAAGAAVSTILNKEDRPETQDIGNLWKRLVYAKTGIPIPDSIRWDGKSDSGAVAPDGTYTFAVEAWDDNGNTGTSAAGTVVVDNTPPSLTLSAPYLIFSPNSDGNKDALVVQQTGSVEEKWTGVFSDVAGTAVASFTWEKQALAAWEWNGKNEQGLRVPDGVYSYRVTATDRAGNGALAQLDNVIVDTQETPIQLAIDQSYFSPNGDGVKDAVNFEFRVPVTTGIEKWQLAISDAGKAARRTIAGTLSIPASAVWDGKDDAGEALPEGAYQANLSILYVNGNNPKATSPVITVDVTTPSAAAKADEAVFSPNGDGSKDEVTIFQETSEETFWTGTIRDAAAKEVRNLVWRGRADERFAWDGRDGDGKLLADGTYTYTLTSTDRAGNTVTSAPATVRIDTEATPVIVATDLAVFSPNGDGVKDRIRFLPTLRVASGVDAWSFRVRDEGGGAVRTFTGKNAAPSEVSWDGIDDAGKKAKDGRFAVELEVTYANGNKPRVISNQFRIDTVYPEVSATAEALLFSPDGDGRLDVLTVKQTSSEEDLWEGEVQDAKAKRVRAFFWKGKAADFTWDGKDDNGNRVADGFYTYVVKATRQSGNTTAKSLARIQVDTRATPIYLTASADRILAERRRAPRRSLPLADRHREGRGEILEARARAPVGGQPEGVRGNGGAAGERHLGRQGRLPDRARGHLHRGVHRRVREGKPARGAHAGHAARRERPEGRPLAQPRRRVAAVLARQRRGERRAHDRPQGRRHQRHRKLGTHDPRSAGPPLQPARRQGRAYRTDHLGRHLGHRGARAVRRGLRPDLHHPRRARQHGHGRRQGADRHPRDPGRRPAEGADPEHHLRFELARLHQRRRREGPEEPGGHRAPGGHLQEVLQVQHPRRRARQPRQVRPGEKPRRSEEGAGRGAAAAVQVQGGRDPDRARRAGHRGPPDHHGGQGRR